MNNINNIYLYGISGVYNYGCEAMIRSISEQLNSVYPGSNIFYLSYDYENDTKALKDCKTIKIKKVIYKFENYSIFKVIPKGLRKIRKKLGIGSIDDYISIETNWTDDCDLLVIIGGDVFDLPAEYSEDCQYDNERIFVSKKVKEKKGKVILWGISIGNFDKNIKAKDTLMNYLRNIVDYSIIRDEKSYNYLKENNIKNVSLFSDPAFLQRTLQTSIEHKDIIGINLSPLSNMYLSEKKDYTGWVEYWENVIVELYKSLQYKTIYLIPHVVTKDNKEDDDYQFLYLIYDKLKKRNLNVKLVPPNIGFLGIKQYLIQCDLILAARMHCAINSVTCGVPTVFLSYSAKSYGMCKHVYDNLDNIIDLNKIILDFQSEKNKVLQISKRTDQMRNFLSLKNIELYEDAKKSLKKIVKILK